MVMDTRLGRLTICMRLFSMVPCETGIKQLMYLQACRP